MPSPTHSQSPADLEILLRRLSDDGQLPPDDAVRLNDLLRGDVDACERSLNHMAIDAQLTREAAPEVSPALPFAPKHPVLHTSHRLSLGWVAAAAILIVGALAWFTTGSRNEPPPIATVLFAEGTEWRGFAPEEGHALKVGTIHLQKGIAVIRFHGGAEVALSGDTDLELVTSGSARLTQGQAFVRSADGAEGFHLETPTCKLLDLGTEFSAQVSKEDGTQVHVLEGEVAARTLGKDPSSERILKRGEAMRFAADPSPGEAIPFNATRFSDVIRKAQPHERPDLMLAYDGFHYDAGRYQPEDITRGKGWAGPWRLRSESERPHHQPDETTDMHIVHGKLNVVWPVEGGKLGMLEMPPGKTYRIRPMKTGIDMGRDSVRYFSLMVHEPDHSQTRPDQRPRESVRLTFRSSTDYLGGHLSFGITNRLHPQIQTQPGVGDVSPAEAPSKQTTLWIGKIMTRKHGEDEISFRIYGEDDALDYAEPATWHVLSRGVHQDHKLDLLVLSSEGRSSRVIDEFRLGPTWRSVVPIQVLLTSR